MTPTQEAFLNRVKEQLENPPEVKLTAEQQKAIDDFNKLTDNEKTLLQFTTVRTSLLKQYGNLFDPPLKLESRVDILPYVKNVDGTITLVGK